MRDHLGHAGLVPPLADVPVADRAVSPPRAEHAAVPGHAAHSVRVPVELPDLLGPTGIPDLDLKHQGMKTVSGYLNDKTSTSRSPPCV